MVEDVGPIGSVAANDVIRGTLKSQGDDGTAPREIEHFLFIDPDALDPMRVDNLAEEMAERGFDAKVLEDEDGHESLALVHTDVVVGQEFDEVTEWLAQIMPPLGWTYDGWNCSDVSKNMPEQ